MKIKITRPHPDYPLVHVHVGVEVDTDRPDLADILERSRITLLGRWEPHFKNGSIEGVRAPALLEDEHIKPRKRPTRKVLTRGDIRNPDRS